MTFTWNQSKSQRNLQLYGIFFEEATKALLDPDVHLELDKKHNTASEIRYKAIGFSGTHTLTVIFTVPDEDKEVIRIISAWKTKE